MTREEEAFERARRLLEAQGVRYDREQHVCPRCASTVWLVFRTDPKATPVSYPLRFKCDACQTLVDLTEDTRPAPKSMGSFTDEWFWATNPWRSAPDVNTEPAKQQEQQGDDVQSDHDPADRLRRNHSE